MDCQMDIFRSDKNLMSHKNYKSFSDSKSSLITEYSDMITKSFLGFCKLLKIYGSARISSLSVIRKLHRLIYFEAKKEISCR